MTNTESAPGTSNDDERFDARAFRRCLRQYATGVTVITAAVGDERVGVTASSFASLSYEPPIVLWSIAKTSRSHDTFCRARSFAINILTVSQIDVARTFTSAAEDKFADVLWSKGTSGSPVIPDSIAVIECDTESVFDIGDHSLLIGRVTRFSQSDAEPLLYSQGAFGVVSPHPSQDAESSPAGTQPVESERTVESYNAPTQLGSLISNIHNRNIAEFGTELHGDNLAGALGRLLIEVCLHPGWTAEALSRSAILAPSAADDGILDLTDRGLVFTDRDGRVFATDEGARQRDELGKRWEQRNSEFFSALTAGEIDYLRKLLRRVAVGNDQLQPQ